MKSFSASPRPRSPLGWFAGLFTVIGAVNWGLVGLFNFNLVRSMFGPMSTFSRIIYTLVGFSGLYLLFSFLFTKYEDPSHKRGWSRWWS